MVRPQIHTHSRQRHSRRPLRIVGSGLRRSEAQRPVCPMAAKQRLIGICVVSQRGASLFSPDRGVQCCKFPHVSYQPCHVDITPVQRSGRPTAWTEALQDSHSRASIAVLRLVDHDNRAAVLLTKTTFGACGRSRKSFSTENRSTTARDAHRGSTNFFSESDSQTTGLVPGSASAILTSLPLRSIPREDEWRHAPSPGASKAFSGRSHHAAGYGTSPPTDNASERGVARLARPAWWWRPPRT